ncbi:MAG TPA: DUF72 domain-containing protein [Candidatus Limnocylindrales bacterium]|nr:DUF72 domain-containing protein [Candidatus Limnocylindrales bacterium]
MPGSAAPGRASGGERRTGRLLAGTSGFSYADWIPRFYPAGTRASGLLAAYATQLPAVELNATFRRRPTPSAIRGWLAATPPEFRFAVKAQRSSAIRGLFGSPGETVEWLTEPLGDFGERLGAVLYRVPAEIRRDGPWVEGNVALADERLRALLTAWPRAIPLVVELQDPSWHVDETFAALREAGAVLCITELPPEGDEGATGAGDAPSEPPIVRRTGPFLYLRLRRHDYDAAELDAWAARLQPFLDAGDDAYVFFRHDAVGRAGELALELLRRVGPTT